MSQFNARKSGNTVDEDDDETWDDWANDDEAPTRSLFSDVLLPTPQDIVSHDSQTFGFNLPAIIQQLGLDFYGCVRLVNYIRESVGGLQRPATGEDAAAMLKKLAEDQAWLQDPQYLRPYLEDDALLLALGDMLGSGGQNSDEEDADDGPTPEVVPEDAYSPEDQGTLAAGAPGGAVDSREVATLRAQNDDLREQVRQLKAIVAGLNEDDQEGPDNDTYYFTGYGHYGIHHTMLRDKVRTGAYEDGITGNPGLFAGKVVLDVGCGTGVLSMFAARAGARAVFGVEMSDIIIEARKAVADNGFADVVTLVEGKMEEVDLPVAQVDIIISEWMGYFLFYESMLPSVLHARDKYLAPGGVVLPDKAVLYIEAMQDKEQRLEWWSQVHGLDFSCMRHLRIKEGAVETVPQEAIATDRCALREFDMMDVTDEGLDFECYFRLKVTQAGLISGFVVSFDIGFVKGCDTPVWFSTGPACTPTHWEQAVLWLEMDERPELEVGHTIQGELVLKRDKRNNRLLNVDVKWEAQATSSQRAFGGSQTFFIN